MARTCKKCFLPLGTAETECSNCGAYNPLPVAPMPTQAPTAPAAPTTGRSSAKKAILLSCLLILLPFIVIILTVTFGRDCSSSKEEVEYSHEVKAGDPAYIEIKSIEPVYSVQKQFSTDIEAVVCRCTTASGKTVWVYITPSEYTQHIDSEAKFDRLFGSQYKKIYFSSGTIIHGKAANAAERCGELLADIGTKVLQFESIERPK